MIQNLFDVYLNVMSSTQGPSDMVVAPLRPLWEGVPRKGCQVKRPRHP